MHDEGAVWFVRVVCVVCGVCGVCVGWGGSSQERFSPSLNASDTGNRLGGGSGEERRHHGASEDPVTL
jgi:hypothetical protein